MTDPSADAVPKTLSRQLLLFLSKFLYPQPQDALSRDTRWTEALGELPDHVFRRLMAQGLIGRAEPAVILEWRLNTQQLRALLKERSLPASGRKELMIRRLVEADPNGMITAVQNYDLYTCTAQGRELASEFLAADAETRRVVQLEVLEHLRGRRFREAAQSVARFEASQVLPRGIGIDWASHDPSDDARLLETIFTGHPRILSGIRDDAIEPLRVSAALMHLWGLNRAPDWAPGCTDLGLRFNFDTAARMFLFYASHRLSLARFREADIAQLELLGGSIDSCQPCRRLRKHWRTAEAIELPYEKCTSEMGCRCIMIASVESA